jgi:hypothetical protein
MSETDNIARGNHVVPTEWAEQLERERDEARAELTNIYRWIERNHSDGFIDSLSYSQNLERVTDSWYDRLERVERERDEARDAILGWENKWRCAVDMAARAELERDEAQEKYNNLATENMLAVNKLCNERDEARSDRENSRQSLGFALEELNEARAVADELSAIAARYLGWHLSRTPMGPDDDHLAQARRISETLARWKALASA